METPPLKSTAIVKKLKIAGLFAVLFLCIAFFFQNCGEDSKVGIDNSGNLLSLDGPDDQDDNEDEESQDDDPGNVINGVTLPPLPSCPSDSAPTLHVYYKKTDGQYKEFSSPCGAERNNRGASDANLMANTDIYFRIAVHNSAQTIGACVIESSSHNGINGIKDCSPYLNGTPMVLSGGIPASSGDCFIFKFSMTEPAIRAFCPVALLQ